MIFRRWLAIGALAGATLGEARAQRPKPLPLLAETPALAAKIDRVFADCAPSRPGYAVGVVQHGALVYAKGFGSANLDYGLPITPRSAFNVASLSKQFTAACAAILIHRGSLSLEDPARRYIPEMPAYGASIRVKHLVYMTSGLPEYYRQPRPGGKDWGRDYFTVHDAAAASFAAKKLTFEPGAKWAYSNINYMLLAEIVRRVSDVPFADFAKREIFDPLSMADSHFNVDLGAVVPNRVTGYNRREDGSYRREIRRSPHYGGSGLFTTIEDLARWDRNFETHQLGGPALTELRLSTMKFDHDKANDAFGLVWGEYGGRRTIWYEGGDLGFSSYMVRLPDDRLTVIVLANLGDGRAADRARRVLDVFAEIRP